MDFALLGSDGFKSDSTLDLNIHDTYFVIAHVHFVVLFSVLIFFGIYFLRTLRRNFKNLTANLILIISTILLILILVNVSSIISSLSQFSGSTEYPPLSGGMIEHNGNEFGILSNILFIIQILLLILLTYCGFKTGRNYKQNA